MHWVRGEPGGVDFERELVLVQHPPAEIVFLSAADTELACAEKTFGSAFGKRLELSHAGPLRQPVSADAYVDEVLRECGLVVMRLLGGRAYFPHLIDAIERLKDEGSAVRFLLLGGSDAFDSDLAELSDFSQEEVRTVFEFFSEGGSENFEALGRMLDALSRGEWRPESLQKTEESGRYRVFGTNVKGTAWILFYRAWFQADDLAVVDALGEQLAALGYQAHAFFSFSLRNASAREFLRQQARPDVVITMQSFSIAAKGREGATFFENLDCPVLQAPVSMMRHQDWSSPNAALIPAEVAMNVALPELDGRVLATVAGFKEEARVPAGDQESWVPKQLKPDTGQVRFVANLAHQWARLRNLAAAQKRVAVILSNYPNRDGRIGNGVGLDTPESTVRLLRALRDGGYALDPLPNDARELMAWLTEGVTNDAKQSYGRPVFQTCPHEVVRAELDRLPDFRKTEVLEQWGVLPDADIPVSGIQLGNVFVGIQPARGYSEQTQAVYHSPELPPTPAYFAFYAWLREFGTDAMVEIGKHGNLEWLPGRNTGLGIDDFPQFCLGPVPFVYAFIVNNPGEGSQAKRRTSAVIVDHLTPPLTRAGLYDDLEKAERLLEELAHAATLYPKRQAELEAEIHSLLVNVSWRDEIPKTGTDDEITALDHFLCEIKESQIRSGLHVLGQAPQGKKLEEFLIAVLRSSSRNRKGLFEALNGGDEDWMDWPSPERDALYERAKAFVAANGCATAQDEGAPLSRELLDLAKTGREVAEKLAGCSAEIRNILAALEGRFVPPGPAGAPTRGRLDVLPTGRNFYSLDPRAVPTETAWNAGKRMAEALLERHRQDSGEYPRTVAMVVWGTSNMRTGGDDLAQALWLWGAEPVWDASSGRVIDFNIVPATVLGRPRVDVLLRVSGLFRDAFGETMRLLATIPKRLCELDEPLERNPVRAAYLRDLEAWEQAGFTGPEARERAYLRVFSSAPGAYGAGLLPLLDSQNWRTGDDLTEVFCRWGGTAYDSQGAAHEDIEALRERLSRIDAVHQNQDNREHDILDSDDYFQFHGGLHAAIENLRGEAPATYHGDSSIPDRPRVRTLREEFVRVLRSRVLNPKWIGAMREHGYKGAFEIAASIDYIFGYDATTGIAETHQYDEVARRLLLDPEQQRFFQRHNPQALRESVQRMLEAADRGMWEAPGDGILDALRDVHYTLQSQLE